VPRHPGGKTATFSNFVEVQVVVRCVSVGVVVQVRGGVQRSTATSRIGMMLDVFIY